MGGSKKNKQRIDGGHGNVQIGNLVVHGDTVIQPASGPQRAQTDENRMPLEQRSELTTLVLQIEMAEEELVDAGTIWCAMLKHLNGRGLQDIGADECSLTSAQYWSARTYLDGWFSCVRGDRLQRTAMLRQILRMWEICPALKSATVELCMSRFGISEPAQLNDVQLRAALSVTLADWQYYWRCKAGSNLPIGR